MLGVMPGGEDAKSRAFWIMYESGGYPNVWAYECSRCESVSKQTLRYCPVCGAEMSHMVIQSVWTDFNE